MLAIVSAGVIISAAIMGASLVSVSLFVREAARRPNLTPQCCRDLQRELGSPKVQFRRCRFGRHQRAFRDRDNNGRVLPRDEDFRLQ
jgi:hypothetical protein